MTNLVNRMKSGLQRMGDWITGHDVDVASGPPEAELLDSRATARPLVDVLESDQELMLVADVPGAHSDTTAVHVDGRRLTILARVSNVADAHLLLGGVSDADWFVDFALPRRRGCRLRPRGGAQRCAHGAATQT